MDLVCPCLRSQPWFEVNLYTVGPSGDLSTSSHGSQYESSTHGSYFLLFGPFCTLVFPTLAHHAFQSGFTLRFYYPLWPTPDLLYQRKTPRTNLPIPQGSSQIIFFSVKLLCTLTFQFTFVLW